jgi:transcriptional regulator with XRE-family HTH domain
MARTKLQKQRDKRRVSQMYLQGETQADIAASVGLSQPTVSRILQSLQAEWRDAAIIDISEAKARELAKIDTLELEYWTAWKRSQEDAESEITKLQGGSTDAPSKLEKQTRREGQSGNPAFLAGIQWCINKRCEILGVNAPIKTQQENTGKVVFEVVRKAVSDHPADPSPQANEFPGEPGKA